MDLAPLARAIEVLMSPLDWGSEEDWLSECLRRVRSATGAPGPPDAANAATELEHSLALPGDEPGWLRASLVPGPARRRRPVLPPMGEASQALFPVISLRCALAAGLSKLGRPDPWRSTTGPALPCTRELRRTFGLRGREPQIALLAAGGLSNAEIARRLGLSPHTVRHYLERVLDRLGLHTRKALALHFLVGPGAEAGAPTLGL